MQKDREEKKRKQKEGSSGSKKFTTLLVSQLFHACQNRGCLCPPAWAIKFILPVFELVKVVKPGKICHAEKLHDSLGGRVSIITSGVCETPNCSA